MSVVWGVRWDRRTHATVLALAAGLLAVFVIVRGDADNESDVDPTDAR